MSRFAFDLPDDPSRPVLCALSRAYTENWDACVSAITKAAEVGGARPEETRREYVMQMLEKAASHLRNALELARWVRYPEPLGFEEARRKADAFNELGDEWVQDVLARLQKFPQGRRPTKRLSHIAALEYMLKSSKNSLGSAVKQFCPCRRKQGHGPDCREQFKAGIHALSKMLRKYAPEIVAEYDALHPDRAKRRHGKGFSPHHQ